jgi:hypothetical protein
MLVLVHARVTPLIPALHVQLPVVGWQYMPACVFAGSALHV